MRDRSDFNPIPALIVVAIAVSTVGLSLTGLSPIQAVALFLIEAGWFMLWLVKGANW